MCVRCPLHSGFETISNFNRVICSGHTFHHELVQYIENCFLTLKKLFIASHTIAERVACLYLMYAMYFKQPTKDFGKFRFTLTDWTTMKAFYDEINDNGHEFLQARMIFWHLWQANAFRFVECDLDLESIQNKTQFSAKMFNFRKVNPIIESEVAGLRDESKGLMSAIDILQAGYNEMKEHLSVAMPDCSGLMATKISAEIAEHVNEVQAYFEDDYTQSKRRRELQLRKRAARRLRRNETNVHDDQSDECSATSDSGSIDSNFEPNNMVEAGASSDSDVECLNIGSKRFYLKRKAMNKSAKSLRHMESVSTKTLNSMSVSEQLSPTKKSLAAQRKRKRCVASRESLASPSRGGNRLKKAKRRIKVLEENEKLIVVHSATKWPRSSKLSAVAKQLEHCPPYVNRTQLNRL